jgi:hypothetical protein
LPRLGPDATEAFILAQLDGAGLGHNTFTPEALALIVRSAEGRLRRMRNLCLSALIEAVRDQTRTVELKQINPEPTGEANRCNLGHVTPKTLQTALYVGFSQIGRPLQVVCLGWSQFPIPDARRWPGPRRQA